MSFIVELCDRNCISLYRKNGSRIGKRSSLYADLSDCNKSGDCEDACRFVLKHHKPEFRIVKKIDGNYENVVADFADKIAICKKIYFDSNFKWEESEKWCEIYLIWQCAAELDSSED